MMAAADPDDDILEEAIVYLSEQAYPDGCSGNRKRQIRKKAEKFVIKNDELFYNPGHNKPILKYIKNRSDQLRILKSCHIDVTSGHLGVKKTAHRIKERFMWKGIWKDVNKLVTTCDECQRVNKNPLVIVPELHPVPVRSPWYHVGMDFIGPISPTSKNGNRFILTLSDYFTKWVEAIPLGSKCASGVAKSLFKIFMRMGLPKILTSDQGGEFKSDLEKNIMDLLKIKRHYITPYHPQANGLDERWNQTLKQMIVKFTAGKKELWDEFLDTCVFAYNTAKHDSTHYSPFELMFGRKAILPVDLEFEAHDGKKLLTEFHKTVSEQDKAISSLTDSRQAMLQSAKSNIKTAQEKQKLQYDQRHCPARNKFGIGTKVLRKDFRRKKRRGGGMDYRWLGPYEVIEDVSRGFFRLRSIETGTIIKRIHWVHLKQYFTPPNSPEKEDQDFSHQQSDQSLDSIPPLPPPIVTPSISSVSPTPVHQHTTILCSKNNPPTNNKSQSCLTSSPSSSSRCSLAPEEKVQELQAVSTDKIIELMSQIICSVDDISNTKFLFCNYEEYATLSCKKRQELKWKSDSILCITPDQYNGIIEYLLNIFPPRYKKSGPFSFIADVLFPGLLQQIIMNKFSVNSDEATNIMNTCPYKSTDESPQDYVGKKQVRLVKERKNMDQNQEKLKSTVLGSSTIQPPVKKPSSVFVTTVPAIQPFVRKPSVDCSSLSSVVHSSEGKTEACLPLASIGEQSPSIEVESPKLLSSQKTKVSQNNDNQHHHEVISDPPRKRRKISLAAKKDQKRRQRKHKSLNKPNVPAVDLTHDVTEDLKTNYWVENFELTHLHKKCIEEGDWLTDEIIDAGGKLLKTAYPTMGGLQSPILGETLSFEVCRGDFVQVLNVGKNHWITVSSKDCPDMNQVFVYDSLPFKSVSKRVMEQIAALCFCEKREIHLSICDVQHQKGGSDCGLFALAFAVALCAGEDPLEIVFIQHELRRHLISCLESSSISLFPSRNRKRSPSPSTRTRIQVYCHCRQPDDGTVKMIECTECQEWFHSDCECVPKRAWKSQSCIWKCRNCSK